MSRFEGQGGFTLLELVMALGILGIVGLGFLAGISTATCANQAKADVECVN